MDSNVINISNYVAQKEEERAITGVPVAEKVASGFTCPETGRQFPLLYLVNYPDLSVTEDERLFFSGTYSSVYQLSPRIKGQSSVLAHPAPAISSMLTLAQDAGCWLEVFDLKTASGINGFIMLANRLTASEDDFDTIHSPIGSFGLLVRRDMPHNHGRIVFHASQVREHPLFGEIPFTYVHVLEYDGSVTQGDPILPSTF